jgi:hypothetical protein
VLLGQGRGRGTRCDGGVEDGGGVEDRGAVDAISIALYFDTRGRDSVLFPIRGGKRFY